MTLDWKRNLGDTDRAIRTLIGILLLVLVYTKTITGLWADIIAVFAFFQFLEAALAY